MAKRKIIALLLSIGFSVIALENQLKNSQFFMPAEYKTVKRIVNKLALHNDLGKRPITFTIITGDSTEWQAEKLGLCQKKQCDFFRLLNPFNRYQGSSREKVNEAIRQSYIWGMPQASAYSGHIITIDRSTFIKSFSEENTLACIISHELIHLFDHSHFEAKRKESHRKEYIKNSSKDHLENQLRREAEIEADIGASKLLFNAGLPKNTCKKVRASMFKDYGTYEESKEEDRYPGYEEWMTKMNEFIDNYESNSTTNKALSTKGKWIYRRNRNTIKFVPSQTKELLN